VTACATKLGREQFQRIVALCESSRRPELALMLTVNGQL